jgi:Zn-dependent peptidase ImmA (M78 family)/DNA-binding XRE family transcriptional regulator
MSRGGLQGFQADRLSQILAVRRLTQAQLASLVGVSPGTISKWKAGTQSPELEALTRLASVVNVSPDWFLRPYRPMLSPPLFRSNASAHVAARAMLEGRLEWAEEIACGLAEFVEFPRLILPARDFQNPEELTEEDIEEAADECRKLWRLGRGPVQDLALAVESAGVLLIREETGIPQIEGLSGWSTKLGRPCILLSADKDNGYRGRFDLAHELGHCILHKNIGRVTNRDRYNLMEKQAHAFAGAILLPAEGISQDAPVHPTLDDLLILKRRWGVSAAAILMRLRALSLVDNEEVTNLYKRRSARWGSKAEPGDGERVPEQPRLLRRTVDLLVAEGVMPLESFPRHFGISGNDLEMLMALPSRYFATLEKVVSLTRLRQETAQPGPGLHQLFKNRSADVVTLSQPARASRPSK